MTMKKTFVGLMLAVAMCVAPATFAQDSCTGDEPLVTYPPTAGSVDFCLAFTQVNAYLSAIAGFGFPEVLEFADNLACETADNNGPLDLEADLPVSPNGLLDAEYELGLIAAVCNDTGFSNSAGVTHADVMGALTGNYTFIKGEVDNALDAAGYAGLIDLLAPCLDESLSYILAGYAVIGDANTLGAIDALIGLLGELGVDPPSLDAITSFPGYFGPEGDADGDTVSNRLEYTAYFSASDPSIYVANALDPNTFPEVAGIADGFALLAPAGWVTVGSDITIEFPADLETTPPTSYEWFADGAGVGGDSPILPLNDVQLGDAGVYQLKVTDASKGVFFSKPYTLEVVAESEVPVSGGLGIALLAGACALVGMAGIRRKK